MANKKVVVIPGDDAAPESMSATMDALRAMKLCRLCGTGSIFCRGTDSATSRRTVTPDVEAFCRPFRLRIVCGREDDSNFTGRCESATASRAFRESRM
jgi:hypothetical protein